MIYKNKIYDGCRYCPEEAKGGRERICYCDVTCEYDFVVYENYILSGKQSMLVCRFGIELVKLRHVYVESTRHVLNHCICLVFVVW